MNVSKLPEEVGYLVITESRMYIPGDQRSQDAPGHGYPERYEYYREVKFYRDHEIKAALAKLFVDKKTYQVYRVQPVSVAVEPTVVLT